MFVGDESFKKPINYVVNSAKIDNPVKLEVYEKVPGTIRKLESSWHYILFWGFSLFGLSLENEGPVN